MTEETTNTMTPELVLLVVLWTVVAGFAVYRRYLRPLHIKRLIDDLSSRESALLKMGVPLPSALSTVLGEVAKELAPLSSELMDMKTQALLEFGFKTTERLQALITQEIQDANVSNSSQQALDRCRVAKHAHATGLSAFLDVARSVR